MRDISEFVCQVQSAFSGKWRVEADIQCFVTISVKKDWMFVERDGKIKEEDCISVTTTDHIDEYTSECPSFFFHPEFEEMDMSSFIRARFDQDMASKFVQMCADYSAHKIEIVKEGTTIFSFEPICSK